MNQKGIVSLEVTVNDQTFSFNMPMNGQATYAHALEAAIKIVSDLQSFIKELEARKEAAATEQQPIEPEIVQKED